MQVLARYDYCVLSLALCAASLCVGACCAEKRGYTRGNRYSDGKREFKVRWRGYSEKDDTWEPEDAIASCGELLKQYNATHPASTVPVVETKTSRKPYKVWAVSCGTYDLLCAVPKEDTRSGTAQTAGSCSGPASQTSQTCTSCSSSTDNQTSCSSPISQTSCSGTSSPGEEASKRQ